MKKLFLIFILAFISLTFFAQIEKEVLDLVNEARTQPKQFLKERVEPYIIENELERVRETRSLVQTLKKLDPLPPLVFKENLNQMAQDFAEEAGKKGWVGHIKTQQRFEKYAPEMENTGENIQFIYNDAVSIVIDLLIDQGVQGYGHRKNILDPNFDFFGFGIAPHKKHEFISVMTFGTE